MTLLIVLVLRGTEIFADRPMIDKRDLTDIFNKDSWMYERHGRNSDDDQDCVKCYDESTHQWKAMHWVTRGISDDWHFSPSPPSPSCELQSFNHHSCVFIYLIRVFVCMISSICGSKYCFSWKLETVWVSKSFTWSIIENQEDEDDDDRRVFSPDGSGAWLGLGVFLTGREGRLAVHTLKRHLLLKPDQQLVESIAIIKWKVIIMSILAAAVQLLGTPQVGI